MVPCDGHTGYFVLFGTGKYLGEPDLTDTTTQTIYGVWDYGDDDDDSEYIGTFDPGGTPRLSNLPGGVELLEQTVVFEGDYDVDGDTVNDVYLRVLSDNEYVWNTVDDPTEGQQQNPAPFVDDPNTMEDESTYVSHVGWYFDLPNSKERIISSPMIRDNRLIITSFVPQSDRCSGGGFSLVHEMDPCSGGRLSNPVFDITEDSHIDQSDRITITIDDPDHPGQTITVTVPPTAKKYEGRLHRPAILRDEPSERKYFSTSTGAIEQMTEEAEQRGMYYWKEVY